jgi:hypothetical protein
MRLFSCTDYVRWNGRMIMNHELEITWKGEVLAYFKLQFRHLLGTTEERNTKTLSEDTRILVRDSNSGLLKYEAGELTT